MIEFAAVSLPLMALFIAILQITTTYFAQQCLESAAERAVRQLLTGQAQQAGMTQAQLKQKVCDNLPAFMKCANVAVQVVSASTWSTLVTTPPTITYDSSGNVNNNWGYAPGANRSINLVRTMYVWNVIDGPLGFDISNLSQGRRMLYATLVFQTEPYK